MLFGDPAQNEERRFDLVPVQQIECAESIALQTTLETVPLTSLDHMIEGANLEIIFQRDRQNVTLFVQWVVLRDPLNATTKLGF